MIFWDVILCGLADANTTPYLYQFFPRGLLIYLEDKKEAAGSPEILVPICQTALYQTNRIIVLMLIAIDNLKSNTQNLPSKEYKKNDLMGCNAMYSDRNSKFHSNVLLASSTASSSKVSVNFYQNTWHHIPKHTVLHRCCCTNNTSNLPSGFRFK